MEMKKLTLPAVAVAVVALGTPYVIDAYDAHKMAQQFGAELNGVVLVIKGVSDRVKSGECSIERVDPELTGFDIDCTDGGRGYTSSGVPGRVAERYFSFKNPSGDDARFGIGQFYNPFSDRSVIDFASINDTTCLTNLRTLRLICSIGDGPSVAANNQNILSVIQDSGILEAISALQALAVKESHK
jgi:hypothetical protein